MYQQSFVKVLSTKCHVIYVYRLSSCYMHIHGKMWRSQYAYWYNFVCELDRKKKYKVLVDLLIFSFVFFGSLLASAGFGILFVFSIYTYRLNHFSAVLSFTDYL
jgi:hypothetical protein